jgi:hypothetical protein
MGNFLKIYDLSKLNKEDANDTNRSTASNEIESVIMFFSRKTHDKKHSPLNYIRPCKEELTVMLKLCHKIPRKQQIQTHLMKTGLTKLDEDTTTTTKLQAKIFNEHSSKCS